MVRGERDYSKGKVYRLCHGPITVYIGSSVMPLNKRMNKHNSAARKGKTCRIYQYMREIGIENVRIVLIENWPCTSKMELVQREQYWMDHAKNVFPNVDLKNMLNAYISEEDKRLQMFQYNHSEVGRARNTRCEPRRLETIQCHCCHSVVRKNIARHKKSKRHKKIVKRNVSEVIALMVLSAIVSSAQNNNPQSPDES